MSPHIARVLREEHITHQLLPPAFLPKKSVIFITQSEFSSLPSATAVYSFTFVIFKVISL